jgi:hypothetical protein
MPRRDRLVAAQLYLLKTVNYRESLRIFLCDRRTVGRHDHHSICSRFRALVPVSQPSVAGTRACRPATSANRLAAATPSPPPVSFRRSAPVGVPLPGVASGPRRLGTRQTGDSGQMASPRLSDLLAVAITLSRPPKTSAEIRAMIRQMSGANPLWGAPRVHGELLKLGIEVSQATVGRHLPRRPKAPSPTWRSVLRNQMTAIAAVDMFMVATATFNLLYAVIVLSHHRRRVKFTSATGAVANLAIAFRMRSRWPPIATPRPFSNWASTCPSKSIPISLASKASAYWPRPIPSSHLRTLLIP